MTVPVPDITGVGSWVQSAQRRGPRFLVVGIVNTIFGYSTFALLLLLAGEQVHYLLLLFAAHAVNVLEAFTLYRRFVFRVTGSWLRDLSRFTSVSLAALLGNAIALPIGVEVLGLPVLVAQALVLGATVILSFFAHDRFSFRRGAQAAEVRE